MCGQSWRNNYGCDGRGNKNTDFTAIPLAIDRSSELSERFDADMGSHSPTPNHREVHVAAGTESRKRSTFRHGTQTFPKQNAAPRPALRARPAVNGRNGTRQIHFRLANAIFCSKTSNNIRSRKGMRGKKFSQTIDKRSTVSHGRRFCPPFLGALSQNDKRTGMQ